MFVISCYTAIENEHNDQKIVDFIGFEGKKKRRKYSNNQMFKIVILEAIPLLVLKSLRV